MIIDALCTLLGNLIPLECMQMQFMQQALLGLVIIAPLAAFCGTQVVNSGMAFFSDAIGHSAFAGVALGLLFAVSPNWTMPLLALAVGLGITAVKGGSSLSTDTVIGVFFSAVVAVGLAVVSRNPGTAKDMQMFLYGDILTIGYDDIAILLILSLVFFVFQAFSFNKLTCISLNPQLARAHRIKVGLHKFIFAGLLSLVVIFSVKAVGVLLVTAMLITPAAAARNLSASYGRMVWYSTVIGLISAVAGLLISSLESVRTATGATIVLCSCLIFCISLLFRRKTRN